MLRVGESGYRELDGVRYPCLVESIHFASQTISVLYTDDGKSEKNVPATEFRPHTDLDSRFEALFLEPCAKNDLLSHCMSYLSTLEKVQILAVSSKWYKRLCRAHNWTCFEFTASEGQHESFNDNLNKLLHSTVRHSQSNLAIPLKNLVKKVNCRGTCVNDESIVNLLRHCLKSVSVNCQECSELTDALLVSLMELDSKVSLDLLKCRFRNQRPRAMGRSPFARCHRQRS